MNPQDPERPDQTPPANHDNRPKRPNRPKNRKELGRLRDLGVTGEGAPRDEEQGTPGQSVRPVAPSPASRNERELARKTDRGAERGGRRRHDPDAGPDRQEIRSTHRHGKPGVTAPANAARHDAANNGDDDGADDDGAAAEAGAVRSTAALYPPGYETWLFAALGLVPGDEVRSELIEPLFAFNRFWVDRDRDSDSHERRAEKAVAPQRGVPPLGANYADDGDAMRAYALYYMTIYLPKVWFLLDRCPTVLDRLAKLPTWQMVDLGCGPGTCLWAVLFYLRARRPALLATLRGVRGVDQGSAALDLAARLHAGMVHTWPEFAAVGAEWTCADWRDHLTEPADLLILGNTINELGQPDATLLDAVTATSLIVLEPGTSVVFRSILPLRDRLIDRGWQVRFPCTSHHRCPMGRDNWCHFRINRFALPFIQRMSNRAGRLNPRHHFTGFVLEQGVAMPSAPAEATSVGSTSVWRVLSALRKANRSGIRWLCDGEHHVEVVLNRRERTAGNRLFLDADAGDAMRFTAEPGAAPLHRRRRLLEQDQFATADNPGTIA